jgi:hypothetical protein
MQKPDRQPKKRRTHRGSETPAGATTRPQKPCETWPDGCEKVAAGCRGNGTASRRRAALGESRHTTNKGERVGGHRSGHLLLRIGGRCSTEDIGPQIVARDSASGRGFDLDAILPGHWPAPIYPLPHHGLGDIKTPSKLGLSIDRIHRFLDFGSVHALTIASLSIACNSVVVARISAHA